MKSMESLPGRLLEDVILRLPVKVNGNGLMDKCVSESENTCIRLEASTDPLALGKQSTLTLLHTSSITFVIGRHKNDASWHVFMYSCVFSRS